MNQVASASSTLAAGSTLRDAAAGVIRHLARLRRQVKASLLVQGLARLLFLVLAIAVIDLALDWSIRFDRAQRAVLLALFVALVVWAAYRWLLRPLTRPVSDDALALVVEQADPRLKLRLIGGLQLARLENLPALGMSPALVRAAVLDAARLAEDIRFDAVLNHRRHWQNLMLAGAAALMLIALAAGAVVTAPLRTWFSRNVLLSTATWPQGTVLVIDRLNEDGTVVFPRGDDWIQTVQIGDESRVVPTEVYLDVRGKDNETAISMRRTSPRRFEAAFTAVTEPFEFRARGGDGDTPWVQVVLVDPPELTNVRLIVTPPAYSGAPAEELPAGSGPYQVLPGSSLRIEAQANKQLSRAQIVYDGEPLMPRGDPRPLRNRTATLKSGGDALMAELRPPELVAGTYRFQLEDALGLVNRRPLAFSIRKRSDEAPQIKVELRGISSMVIPAARIPFHCQASDDFGLASIAIKARVTSESGEASADQSLANTPLSTRTNHSFEDAIDLTPLQLGPPANLLLRWEAADNDDVSGPNIGHSPEFILRVVTESELRADLLRREKDLRQQFAALAKEQSELITDSRVLAASLSSQSESAEQGEQLIAGQKRQRLVGERASALAQRMDQMVLEILNNRLEEAEAPLPRRLAESIAKPIRLLAEQEVPAAADKLGAARLAQSERRMTALNEAIAQQERIHAQMNAILEQLTQSEGFQEAVNLLYEIEKAQADVHEQTTKAHEERIRRILEAANPQEP